MLTCPSCGEENSEPARFCQACGAPLGEAVHAVEERKVVSILFCDLVGFTTRSDEADPEDVAATVRNYHVEVKREVERFGGTLEKFIGDGAMAAFGAPVAHEDDPERAVRAALRILELIDELNEEHEGLDLSIRVAVNTGEVLVSLGGDQSEREGILGDAVNVASRLEGVAPVGSVVVGEQTYRATRDSVDYEELDPVRVKGKAEPIPLWRALQVRSRFGVDVEAPSTPFIGRERELSLLQSGFERTVSGSSVQLVTVTGEPGIGKTRLISELASWVDARPEFVVWRQGRCLPYGDGITFWALGEIVKAHAGILESDSPEIVSSKLGAAVVKPESDPDGLWLRQRLRPLVGLEAPEAAREENFTAWRTFLESVAEESPTVLVFEDIHWADDALLSFVDNLVEYAESIPLLVICLSRPELFDRWKTWGGGKRNSNIIDLAPLTESETGLLIANLLEQSVLPADVQASIQHVSEGNPLYAEEFVRLLKDRGILSRDGATWRMDPAAGIPTPSSVQGLIAARLDLLPNEGKQILQAASVIGKVFWAGAIVSGSLDPNVVGRVLHELSRKELVRAVRRSSVEGETEYSFSHALVRDVCYQQIPRASRAELHIAAAAWIEGVAPDRTEDHAEILASHYLTALELTRAARGETAALETKALECLVIAGDNALGLDVEQAEHHYARALQLTRKGHSQRPAVLSRHAETLRQRDRLSEAADEFEEAVAGFREAGERRPLAQALGRYATVLGDQADPAWMSATEEAVSILEEDGPSPDLVQALGNNAATIWLSGDNEGAIALAERALSIAEELGLPEQSRALGFRGAARCMSGDAGGFDDMRRALEAARAQGLSREVCVWLFDSGAARWDLEGPGACVDGTTQTLDFAWSRGIEEWVHGATAMGLDALVDVGSWDEVVEQAALLGPTLEESGSVGSLCWVRSALARVLARRGDPSLASIDASWLIEMGKRVGIVVGISDVLQVAALVLLTQGDSQGALAALRDLCEMHIAHQNTFYAAKLPESIRIAILAGDPDLGDRLRSDLEPVYPLREHALVTSEAILAETAGRLPEAAAGFADAALRWEGFGVPWERAQALLGEGRCLLALGKPADAARPLKDARTVLFSLKARPALAEVDDLLANRVRRSS